MKPTFKISGRDRIYIDDKYISNGHWLVAKPIQLPAFKKWYNLKNGTYIGDVWQYGHIPNMERTVSSIDLGKYTEFVGTPTACISKRYEISGYMFGDVTLDSKYVLLCTLGKIYIKDNTSPVVIMHSNEIKAIIMPRRK